MTASRVEQLTTQQRLDLLRAVTGTVIGTRPIQEDLTEHARLVCEALDVDFCIMRRLVQGELHYVASYGIDASLLEPVIESNLGIAQTIIDTKKPVQAPDIHALPEAASYFLRPRKLDFTAYAGAPMLIGTEVFGVMGVYCLEEKREFSDPDLDLLSALANHITVALRNHELYEQLNQLNEELDRRVQERTLELEAANHELEAFTYTVAHDLRAPLRGIVSNCQILIEDFGEEIPRHAHAHIERQATSAKRLAMMMDGLLGLTRIGRHELQKAQMSLSRMAEELSLELIRSNNVLTPQFSVEPNIIVDADPRLMRALLQNLFENAIKFARPEQPAQISVHTDPADPSASFIVEDRGIGFEPEFADKIFQPFERLVRENEYPGTGIGLASVKRIVDKHRGTVQASCKPGEWTRITIRLRS